MTYRKTFLVGGGLIFGVILVSGFTFYYSIGPCPRGSFPCDKGATCVPQRKICDKHNDCDDKEDEHPMTCGMLYGGKSLIEYMMHLVDELPPTGSCSFRLEGCLRKCDPLPTMFCKGMRLQGLPRFIQESSAEPTAGAVTDQLPILRLHMPYNRLQLEDSTFENFIIEYLDLGNNHIRSIPKKAFAGQRYLKKLYLNGNNIEEIKRGSFSGLTKLEWLFLEDNRLTLFPLEDLVDSAGHLMWLNFSNNYLRFDSEGEGGGGVSFPALGHLWDLNLDNNRIESIGPKLFAQLSQLEVLGLSGNRISFIHPLAFQGLINLRDLRLAHNRLSQLPDNFLRLNPLLEVLYLNNNPEMEIKMSLYGDFPNVTFLNLAGIRFDHINFDDINALPNLLYTIYDRFYFCSMTPRILRCQPRSDGISSYANLLENRILRYSAWMMSVLTCLGNVLVLWVRCSQTNENKNVSMIIRNLAFADLLMGIYLLVISVQDVRYRDIYHQKANGWVASWSCVASGIIAMVSSEVSLLILAFMSIDRFFVIVDPFRRQNRMASKRIDGPLLFIWLLGIMISVLPVIYYRSGSKFYGIYSGTCFPLRLERLLYSSGWDFSAILFLIVNLTLLIVMVLLYSGLLVSIRRTSRATPLPFKDGEITIRFFFIVLTSASCWAPIIGLKWLGIFGYEFGLDIYAFVVVYLLPLNSAINPLLYTFTTPHYLQRIVTRHWQNLLQFKCVHHHILTNTNGGSGGGGGGLGTINYYSNQDESLRKIVSFEGDAIPRPQTDDGQLEMSKAVSSPILKW